MRAPWLALLAGCWNPSYPAGLHCSDAGTCPPDQVCQGGWCVGPDDPGPDGAQSADGGFDAPVVRIDAALSAAGLGRPCSAGFPCPESTPICRSTDGDATNGFCTLDCGVDQGGGVVADHAPCANGYVEAEGVPRCLFADDLAAPTRWFCGLSCGAGSAPVDDGACPHDLACNLQQDGDAAGEICGE